MANQTRETFVNKGTFWILRINNWNRKLRFQITLLKLDSELVSPSANNTHT